MPLYRIFFICSSDDGHLDCYCILSVMNNVQVNMRVLLLPFEIMILICLDKYPEMGFLGHMVVLF